MKKRKILAMLMTATLSVGLLAGCGTDNAKEETQNTEEKTDEATEENSSDTSEEQGTDEEVSGFSDGTDEKGTVTDEAVLDTSQPLIGIHHAEIEVKDYGTIKVELDADTAPISVTNFVKLAQEHFYDGLTFHRIIDGFMIQGGDPEGTGRGGSDETIKGEFSENGVKRRNLHGKILRSGQRKLPVLYCAVRQHLSGRTVCSFRPCDRGHGHCGPDLQGCQADG